VRVKGGKREARPSYFPVFSHKARKAWQEHLFDRAKEAFYLPTPAWVAGPGKNKRHFQISGDLFQMATGKV
jgi:hypothetical protein